MQGVITASINVVEGFLRALLGLETVGRRDREREDLVLAAVVFSRHVNHKGCLQTQENSGELRDH